MDKFLSLVKRFDPHAMHLISPVKCLSIFRTKNASRVNRKLSLMKGSVSSMIEKNLFVKKNLPQEMSRFLREAEGRRPVI